MKNGDTESYAEFLDAALAGWTGPGAARGFWRGQNLVTIARRWAKHVGAENLLLVTVPPPGADPDVLWQRFREAAGLPEGLYAAPLGAIAERFPGLSIGSYPSYSPEGFTNQIVVRGRDKQALEQATTEIRAMVDELRTSRA